MTVGPTGEGLRVLSYNVHRWGDDRTALARVVQACAPDVMLVQEAPTWWGTRRKRRAMAASFGMRYVAGSARNAILVADGTELAEPLHWRIWRPFVRRRLRLDRHPTPRRRRRRPRHPRHRAGSPWSSATSACTSSAASTNSNRSCSGCRSFGTPYLLVGDLNEEPDGPVWKRLAEEGLTDLGADAGPTFSSTNPHKRIDGAHLSPA